MTKTTWTIKDTLIATVVVVVWGFNFVPMKFALQWLTPFELGVWRYVFAAVPLCFFFRLPKVRLRWLLLSGMLQGVGQFSLLFYSIEVGMTAALASVLMQTQLYFTALWSFLLYRQRPGKLLWGCMAIAAIGLFCYAVSAVSGGGEVTLLGIALALSGASMWAAANLIARIVVHETPDYNPLGYIVWSGFPIALGFLVLLVVFSPNDAARWLSWQTWQNLPPMLWVSFTYLGWLSTVVAYGLWTLLLKRHDANKVAPFSLGVPITGLLSGIVFLDERVDSWQWLGTLFVGLSLLLVVLSPTLAKRRESHKIK